MAQGRRRAGRFGPALFVAAVLSVFPASVFLQQRQPVSSFSVVEATIPEMQRALVQKRVTSRELVDQYLARIQKYNGTLNALITLNPRAREEADALDRERAAGRVRGPLHGIPVAVKDNIQTTTMPTTGGALVFKGFVPPYEATLVKNLRDAGAIVIAKTTMTELANWIARGMPDNYNAIVGFAMNPYDPRRDPRGGSNDGRCVLDTGGSSSGAGTAASLWAASVGTETSGSIISPANQNMLVGIKPTVGRISRYGVIPITADQDTPGPMARTVTDAAVLLGAMEGVADSHDGATNRCARVPRNDYTTFLRRDALKGARVGIARVYPDGELNRDESARMAEVAAILRREGAVVVDPADVPTVVGGVYRRWPICAGVEYAKGKDGGCSSVLKYGMKRDFNRWLASLGSAAPVKTLTELRAWNRAHAGEGALKFGQAELDISDEMDVQADRARYEADRSRDLKMAGEDGIDAVMRQHRLDALVFPSLGGYDIPARAGYPSVIVPFGFITESVTPAFPKGFDPKPTPFGVMFTAGACSDPRLISLAYAFEQATRGRVPPPQFP